MGRKRIIRSSDASPDNFNLKLQPGYRDLLERLSAKAGKSQTQILHDGLDRLEPHSHGNYAVDAAGYEKTITDLMNYDLSYELVTHHQVLLFVNDLQRWASVHDHAKKIGSRIGKRTFTTFIHVTGEKDSAIEGWKNIRQHRSADDVDAAIRQERFGIYLWPRGNKADTSLTFVTEEMCVLGSYDLINPNVGQIYRPVSGGPVWGIVFNSLVNYQRPERFVGADILELHNFHD
ncbi:hypothetical protein [Rhizobium leguminosarum]|uniref:hypothetical protein n=1 Tax=Rhizobium leguminosarum TaxID=384 RepID=UPI001C95C9D7|nr:hypothetical protein [Rhizobium leguminosarum]MBY5698381.1 hypothetical protein [Rhizobium leguminosarum]